ncbi:DUF4336 domain-containing protein [Ruegeria jejuensis]|uniref:DUF4336 domain-containing protein n=1 Tax=Ruegeria jejuensis TaxID=3233338 RepID=UPI00355C9B0E
MLVSLRGGLHYGEADVTFYGCGIQTRMSVVELPDGGLLVISPLVLTGDLRQELDALGPVRHVAAPNKIHNQGLASFAEAYPRAQIWAAPGLPERCPEIAFAGVVEDDPHPDWSPVLKQALTQGNIFFSEVVFLHIASRTLIVADLVENLADETVKSGATRQLSKAFHIFGRPLPSPEFRMYTTDAEAAKRSLDHINTWDFDRILMAHGGIITENAHSVLSEVRDFLVSEVTTRSAHRAALYRFFAARQ